MKRDIKRGTIHAEKRESFDEPSAPHVKSKTCEKRDWGCKMKMRERDEREKERDR